MYKWDIEDMFLDEGNCEKVIESFSDSDWQPLLALIPLLESTSSFGEGPEENERDDGTWVLLSCLKAPIVSKFVESVYAIPIIIDFDWSAWDEGRGLAHDEDFDYDTTDLVTKCRMVTAIVRNDRYCEGALVSAFESGLILKILKSIEKEVSG